MERGTYHRPQHTKFKKGCAPPMAGSEKGPANAGPQIRIPDAQGQAAAGTQGPLLEGATWRVSATDSHHTRCSRASSHGNSGATPSGGHLARQCHGFASYPEQKVSDEKHPQRIRPERAPPRRVRATNSIGKANYSRIIKSPTR